MKRLVFLLLERPPNRSSIGIDATTKNKNYEFSILVRSIEEMEKLVDKMKDVWV